MSRRLIDITGQRFAMLTVLEQSESSKAGHPKWLCRCDCGNTKIVHSYSLRKGKTRSCGCASARLVSEARQKDLVGNVYGRLTVVRRVESAKWLCGCSCGKGHVCATNNLTSGRTRSCGCLFRDTISDLLIKRPTPGTRYNKLTIQPGEPIKRGQTYRWPCICDCGNQLYCILSQISGGNTKSCGCLRRENSRLQGKKFGGLVGHEDGPSQFAENPDYANRPALLYLVEVDGCLDKIGIAFDISRRGRRSFTKIHYQRQMTRANCWAVEQAALWHTRHQKPDRIPSEVRLNKGHSELRAGLDIQKTIKMMDELADRCERVGWAAVWSEIQKQLWKEN